jgi:hypothetical protein
VVAAVGPEVQESSSDKECNQGNHITVYDSFSLGSNSRYIEYEALKWSFQYIPYNSLIFPIYILVFIKLIML